jgi:hypothetical protein
MEDLRAVSYGHAVSSLGYEVKVGKNEMTWKDGDHMIRWEFKKQKDGTIAIQRASRSVTNHKHDQGKEKVLGERELTIIDGLVDKAMKVLRIKAIWA